MLCLEGSQFEEFPAPSPVSFLMPCKLPYLSYPACYVGGFVKPLVATV